MRRRIWLAALGLVALVLWWVSRPPARTVKEVVPSRHRQLSERKTEQRTGHKAQTTPPTAPGSGSQPAVPTEEGGVVAPVWLFYQDWERGDLPGAYRMMSSSWQGTHDYQSFLAALPKSPPHLTEVVVLSTGNFNAELQVTVRSAQGKSSFEVPVVNEAGPPTAPSSAWRLSALPIPTQASPSSP